MMARVLILIVLVSSLSSESLLQILIKTYERVHASSDGLSAHIVSNIRNNRKEQRQD